MRIRSWVSSATLFVVLSVPLIATAQLGPNNPGPVPSQGPQENEELAKMKKDMAKKANKERQAELQRDTEKLFKLASELKDYVGKTNENILSVDVIKKADEIEKLAHDVKEKMKSSY